MGCSPSRSKDVEENNTLQRRSIGVNTDLTVTIKKHPRFGDDCQIVALTSSSYDIFKTDALKHNGELRCSSICKTSICKSSVSYKDGLERSSCSDRSNLHTLQNSKIDEGDKRARREANKVETANTWEIMAGLEDEECKLSKQGPVLRGPRSMQKSLSADFKSTDDRKRSRRENVVCKYTCSPTEMSIAIASVESPRQRRENKLLSSSSSSSVGSCSSGSSVASRRKSLQSFFSEEVSSVSDLTPPLANRQIGSVINLPTESAFSVMKYPMHGVTGAPSVSGCLFSRHIRSISEDGPSINSQTLRVRCENNTGGETQHPPASRILTQQAIMAGSSNVSFDSGIRLSLEETLKSPADEVKSGTSPSPEEQSDAKPATTTELVESSIIQSVLEETTERLKSFELKCPPNGEDRIVLYSTSLGGIRKTFENCKKVREVLERLGVAVDERDVSMDAGYLKEMRDLLQKSEAVPRLFVRGRYIGGAEDVIELHEEGRLVGLLDGLPRHGKVCQGCGGVRFIPCSQCNGSCKVVVGGGEVLRCTNCNENGLARCPSCS